MTETRNCKDYCRFAQHCYIKGGEGVDPDECPMYFKIEDLLWDAECARREELREEEREDLDDWEE